jgi:hypothetical protein
MIALRVQDPAARHEEAYSIWRPGDVPETAPQKSFHQTISIRAAIRAMQNVAYLPCIPQAF